MQVITTPMRQLHLALQSRSQLGSTSSVLILVILKVAKARLTDLQQHAKPTLEDT